MLKILLSRDKGWLGEFFVEAGDFDLLAVFRDFLKIVGRSEISEFLLEFLLKFYRDLVSTFSDERDGSTIRASPPPTTTARPPTA